MNGYTWMVQQGDLRLTSSANPTSSVFEEMYEAHNYSSDGRALCASQSEAYGTFGYRRQQRRETYMELNEHNRVANKDTNVGPRVGHPDPHFSRASETVDLAANSGYCDGDDNFTCSCLATDHSSPFTASKLFLKAYCNSGQACGPFKIWVKAVICKGFGFYLNTDTETCMPCPAGKFSIFDGALDDSHCIQCPQSTYQTKAAQTTCDTCGAGTYSSAEGSAKPENETCLSCPEGKWSDSIGATHESTCILCIPGRYSNSTRSTTSEVCKACWPGTFATVQGATSASVCTVCPSAWYQDGAAATNCKICREHHYIANDGVAKNHDSPLDCKLCADNCFADAGAEECWCHDVEHCESCDFGSTRFYYN